MGSDGTYFNCLASDLIVSHRQRPSANVQCLAGTNRYIRSNNRGAVEIEDAECVAKSYPEFFDDLEILGATLQIVSK